MYLDRVSLIQKVLAKGVTLTPFEAIHLKYLSRKGILDDIPKALKSTDPYKAIEDTGSSISPYMVEFITQKAAEESHEEYFNLNYAYEYLIDQDSNSSKQGFLGLMLMTQLRLIKAEFQTAPIKKVQKSLLHFSSYSYYHLEEKTFTETLETLGSTFKLLIQDIDNILTTNYYLNQLVELSDLNCLHILKMWLSKPEGSEKDFEFMNGAYLCCGSKIISEILDYNHGSYVSSLERKVGHLPFDFEESSLKYVKDVIRGIVPEGSL